MHAFSKYQELKLSELKSQQKPSMLLMNSQKIVTFQDKLHLTNLLNEENK